MYPFSDRLIEAVETMPPNEFEEFLAGWREELDTILRTDPLGFIGHKCKAAAREIHSQFPCRDILLAYVQLLTSWSPNFASVVTIPSLHLRQPNLEGLASFCFRRFEWSPADLHAKFEKFIWPGVTLRMLCQVSGPSGGIVFYILIPVIYPSPHHVMSCHTSDQLPYWESFDVRCALFRTALSLSTEDVFKAALS